MAETAHLLSDFKPAMSRHLAALFIVLSIAATWCNASTAAAAGLDFKITVEAGQHDRTNTPVLAHLLVPKERADVQVVELVDPAGKFVTGQLTPDGLFHLIGLAQGTVRRELHFILPSLKKGESITYTLREATAKPSEQFAWHDTPGDYDDLTFGTRPVLRYMYKPLDDSSKEAREQTYKVYHHLFDPTGKQIVTKGPGGQYTHHRGLYFGFNRISYGGGKKCDTWHCSGDAFQSHDKFLAADAGAVLGRQRLEIGWHGVGKETFATEEREMTVYHIPGGQMVEFASRLRSNVGPVRLDGDPQHAGFQFRASNEVSEKTKAQTYYLRPDGQGKPGETRNWDAKKPDPKCANLPWNALSFVLGGQRYTAVYLDKPTNPKEARYSERDYGRFGSYFEYDLDTNKPLELNYRVWLQAGEMTAEQVKALSADFVESPKVKAVRL